MRRTGFLFSSTAVLICLCAFSCKKGNDAQPASYTSHMGGVRNWHGSHYYDASGPHFPSPIHESYNYPDTSFALTIVDDTTVSVLGNTFHYSTTDSARQIYFFGTANFFYQYGMGTGIAYYYAKDSIVYCSGDKHATTDYWTRSDLRYTY